MNSHNNTIPDDPRTRMTNWRRIIYRLAIALTIGIPTSIVSVKVFNIEVPLLAKAATTSVQPDNVRELHDGDSIPRISKSVKVPILHYAPGQQPVVEVIDTGYGHYFYFPAVVKNGCAYFELDAGNPQDTGRVFKVRGLLFSGNVKVPIGADLEKPLTADDLFPQLLLYRE